MSIAVRRHDLAAMIRAHGSVAANGSPTEVEQAIDAAITALHDLPSLVAELEAAVLDPARPPIERLGALAGLLYGVAQEDTLSDDLPGAYGWLDDWLVLASSRWLYVRPPDPARMSEFAAHTRRVWSALPPSVLPALMQFVGQIEPERAALAAVPLPKLRAILEQQLASPAPFRITVPPYQPVGAPRDPMGGRVTTAHGMQWSDGKAMQFSFEGADRSGSRAAGRSSAALDRRSAARCIRRATRLVEPGTV